MSQVAAFGRLCGTTAARARPARGTPAASSLGQYRHGAPVKTPADEIAHEDPRILRCPSWIHTPNAVFSRYGAGESFLPQSKEHQRTMYIYLFEAAQHHLKSDSRCMLTDLARDFACLAVCRCFNCDWPL